MCSPLSFDGFVICSWEIYGEKLRGGSACTRALRPTAREHLYGMARGKAPPPTGGPGAWEDLNLTLVTSP